MRFITLDPETFRAFAAKSPYKSFMQTPEIAALRAKSGWNATYYGVEISESTKDDKTPQLAAAIMVLGKTTFLGHKTFYAPGGPLLDLENKSLTNFFFKHLTAELKKQHGYILKISPYYELIERDRDGQPIEHGFHHQKALKYLQTLNFKPSKSTDQPQYLFVKDLNHASPEELLASFKRNTRNHIKKAEKMGVRVRELQKSELHILKSITESTSKRRNFTDQPLSYYENMYDLFAPRNEAKFLVAEANHVPLSAAMFITYGDEVIYLFSGSDEKYMREYNAQYAIQWHMLKFASENDFQKYNFYGINGLPDPASKDYGIYDFKKGFGGHVVELIGSYDLSLNKPLHTLHQLLSKIRHLKK